MDVSKIDIKFVESLGLQYNSAKYFFETEPVDAPAKIQKKIRKRIEKYHIPAETYPPEVMQYIGKDVSDEDFLKFLKECYDWVELNDTQKKQLFDEASTDLTEEVKDAIQTLIEDYDYYGNIRKVGKDAQFDVGYNAGYDRTLTLVNASGVPEGSFDCLSFEDGSLIKQSDEYILSGEAENYDDSTTPFSIRFTDAKVDVTLFRADEQSSSVTPLEYLASIAGNILNKHLFLPSEYLNSKEKELLPLITEICALSNWIFIPDESNPADFSQLKSYVVRLGYNELLPLFESLEKNFSDDKKKNRIIKKLRSNLNTQKYEPLWRELYNTIVETQVEYPSKATAYCTTELLDETRSRIQRLMESHGYSGVYPDFIKKGTTRGIHLAESYDTSYFVGAKKNAVYHIHCTEEYYNEHLSIEFMCGTEILRKNETAGDIYSCMFDAKGRRFFKTVSYESDYINPDGECETQNLEQRVQIAVKRAEFIKLTKEEREEVCDTLPRWQIFLLMTLAFGVIGGLLFSIIMIIGFMLMGVLLCLIFAMPQAIPSMFLEIPWLKLFLLAFGLSFVGMGILEVISLRK